MITSTLGAICFLIGFAQEPSQVKPAPRVTFTCSAEGARTVIRRLGTTLGLELDVDPEVSEDRLVLSVKDVPLKTLMGHIAKATGGDWEERGNGYRLVRTQEGRLKEERETVARRETLFATLLDAEKQQLAREPNRTVQDLAGAAKSISDVMRGGRDGGDMLPKVQALTASLPSRTALRQILTSMRPADLASLPPDRRVVFSDAPTSAQRPMPTSWQKLIAQAVSKHAQLAKLVAEAELTTSFRPDETREVGFPVLDTLSRAVPSRIGKCLVSIVRYVPSRPDLPYANLTLTVSDSNGKVVLTSAFSLRKGTNLAPKSQGKSEVTSLSPVATEFSRFIAGGGVAEPSPALAARLIECDRNDPLGIVASEMLIKSFEAQKINLVANLPDAGILDLIPKRPGGTFSTDEVGKAMETSSTLRVSNEEGWSIVAPAEPRYARETRVDRTTLSRALRTIDARILSLPALAEFCLQNPGLTAANPIPGLYFRTLASNGEMYHQLPLEWHRLIGAQISGMNADLRGPEGTSLAPAGYRWLDHLLHSGRARLASRPSEDKALAFGSLREEPTESIPRGLSSGVRIQLVERLANSEVFVFKSPTAAPARFPLGSFRDILGGTTSVQERETLGASAVQLVERGDFSYVQRCDVFAMTFRLAFPGGLYSQATLRVPALSRRCKSSAEISAILN